MVVPAGGLFALPPDADRAQLAMLGINPPTAVAAAQRIRRPTAQPVGGPERRELRVGRWVIAFAKARRLKTINIVRRAELVSELEAVGADVVVVDSPDVTGRIREAVGPCGDSRSRSTGSADQRRALWQRSSRPVERWSATRR